MFDTGILTPSSGGSDNGFISSVLSGLGTGLKKVTEEILPVWTAQQLNVQTKPQLDQMTLDQAAMAQRADALNVQPTLWDNITKSTNLSSGAVLMIGVGLIGLVVVVKLIK